jgi:hypothetical protein
MAAAEPTTPSPGKSPARGTPMARLWRYNYAILLGAGYWIIVLPVAASQVVTLWMFALAGDFSESTASVIAELMTPILGAFLVAHAMAPEYRSGIGAVLACKPVSLHRVVTMRVALALLLPVALAAVTLGVCSLGLKPINVGAALWPALPSLWFLAMLALTFSTLFRSSLGGFSVAAGLWALDVSLGFAVHPFLSLQGRAAVLNGEPLGEHWIWGKVALTVLGTLLLLVHGRLIPRICRAPERRDVLRMVAAIALVLLAYCTSGAAATLAYAHAHRGYLRQPDDVWLQRQLRVYGPLPVARLFGPAFAEYIIEPPKQRGGGSSKQLRVQQLENLLRRWPNSIWADGAAFALATLRESLDPERAAAAYFLVADRYPRSPFAVKALARLVRNDPGTVTPAEQLQAARRLLADYSRWNESERATAYLLTRYPEAVKADELLRASLNAAEVGPRHMRPTWLVQAAELEVVLGNTQRARELALQARESALALQAEAQRLTETPSELMSRRPIFDAALRDAEALLRRLGAG